MSKCFTLVVELVNVTDTTASWTNFSNYKLLTYLNKWEEKRRELELAERDGEGKNKKKDPIFLGVQSTGQIQHSRFSWLAAEQNVQVYLHTKDPPCLFDVVWALSVLLSLQLHLLFSNLLATSPQRASLCLLCPSPPHCHYPTAFNRVKPVLLQDADQSSEGMLTTTPTPGHVVHALPMIKILNFH